MTRLNRKKLKAIKDLLRWKVPFGILPVILPAIMLFPEVNWWEFACLAGGSLCVVLMVHVVDDISGFKSGTDIVNKEQKNEIGHPKALVRGDISVSGAKILAVSLFALGWVFAILLLTAFDNSIWLLPMGLFVMFYAYSYSGPPLKLSYHGLGETVLIICGGIAPVTLSYYILANEFTLEVFWLGAFLGGLFSSVLISAQQADMEGDLQSNRNTLAVIITQRWGARGANRWLFCYHTFWMAFILIGVIFDIVFWGTIFLAAPFPLYALQFIEASKGNHYEARNKSLRAWQAVFISTCIIYIFA